MRPSSQQKLLKLASTSQPGSFFASGSYPAAYKLSMRPKTSTAQNRRPSPPSARGPRTFQAYNCPSSFKFTQNIDAEKHYHKQSVSDDMKALSYHTEGNKLCKQGQYTQAIEQYQKAFNCRAKVVGSSNHHSLALFTCDTACALTALKQYETAKQIFDQTLQLLKSPESDQKVVYRTLINYASLLEKLENYGGSVKVTHKALDAHKMALPLDHEGHGRLIKKLGNIYELCEDVIAAEEQYFRAKDHFEEWQLTDVKGYFDTLMNIGSLRFDEQDFEEASLYLKQGIDGLLENDFGRGEELTLALINLTIALVHTKQDHAAVVYMKKAVDVAEETTPPNKFLLGICYMKMGLIHQNSVQLDRAKEFYEMALETMKSVGEQNIFITPIQILLHDCDRVKEQVEQAQTTTTKSKFSTLAQALLLKRLS